MVPENLQQRVVEFAGNLRPFRQAFVESERKLSFGHLADAGTIAVITQAATRNATLATMVRGFLDPAPAKQRNQVVLQQETAINETPTDKKKRALSETKTTAIKIEQRNRAGLKKVEPDRCKSDSQQAGNAKPGLLGRLYDFGARHRGLDAAVRTEPLCDFKMSRRPL